MREETVSLNNGLPATLRICIKHIHDSGSEVVQHHWSGTSSVHKCVRKNGLESTTNATRTGIKQQRGLGPMWILLGGSGTLHFLAIIKMCPCACSGFSGMHQFPLVTFNISEAIRHWQIKQPMLSPPWGKVPFALALFSAWERWIFGGNFVTCICRTTEFERHQP